MRFLVVVDIILDSQDGKGILILLEFCLIWSSCESPARQFFFWFCFLKKKKKKTLFVQEINMIILTSRNFEWFDEYLSVIFRSSLRRCSIRKGGLRNFAKFTGKHLRQSHCFKKDSGPGVFLWILENFSDHIFYRTRHSDCFSILYCGWLYMVGIDNASSQKTYFFKFRVIVIIAVAVVDTRIWYGDFEFWIRFCKEQTCIASDS